jgi:predicted transcriptional regulator
MTMLSFRVADDDADAVQRWADALSVDRSEILRDALHRHLVVLNGEADARRGLVRLDRCSGVTSGSPPPREETGRYW